MFDFPRKALGFSLLLSVFGFPIGTYAQSFEDQLCGLTLVDDDIVGNYSFTTSTGVLAMDTMVGPVPGVNLTATVFSLNGQLALTTDDGTLELSLNYARPDEKFPMLSQSPTGKISNGKPEYTQIYDDANLGMGCGTELLPILSGTGSHATDGGPRMSTVANLFVHGMTENGISAHGVLVSTGSGLTLTIPFSIEPSG